MYGSRRGGPPARLVPFDEGQNVVEAIKVDGLVQDEKRPRERAGRRLLIAGVHGLGAETRCDDEWDMCCARIAELAPSHLPPINAGPEVEIEKDDVEALLGSEFLDRLLAVSSLDHVMILRRKRGNEPLPEPVIVLDDENVHVSAPLCRQPWYPSMAIEPPPALQVCPSLSTCKEPGTFGSPCLTQHRCVVSSFCVQLFARASMFHPCLSGGSTQYKCLPSQLVQGHECVPPRS